MNFLSQLNLIQFRNYTNQVFNFDNNIICICGKNGTGKTNILDAIYSLSFCKSYFGRSDNSNVQHQMHGFRIDGFYTPNALKASIVLRENGKKEFLINEEAYEKLSLHIGKIPCVFVAPDDVELITGASELRRRLLDTILSQIDSEYLINLIQYNQLLQQRNSLLKKINVEGVIDEDLLAVLNKQLVLKASFIYEKRVHFLNTFLPKILYYYALIAENNEAIECKYHSQLNNHNYAKLLNDSLQQDIALQRTTIGIHKDDIETFLGDVKFKLEASQGQKKSLLFAFKLAEWQILKENKKETPILLLDDVFEKLDAKRLQQLMKIVCEEKDAQIFITDTHKERLQAHFNGLNQTIQIIEL